MTVLIYYDKTAAERDTTENTSRTSTFLTLLVLQGAACIVGCCLYCRVLLVL